MTQGGFNVFYLSVIILNLAIITVLYYYAYKNLLINGL